MDEITSLSGRIRRDSWALQSVRMRQAARKAFDLTHFGNGPAERLCSALILGAAFFFVALMICHLTGLQPTYAIGVAGLGLLSVMAASALLVLWRSDAQLEVEGPYLEKELRELRLELREAEADREAEEEAAERAARRRPPTKRCPYCREVIQARALKCKHCGEILDDDLRDERRPRQARWNPGVAAVLSFFIPGLGQIYKGQVLNGLAWLFVVLFGYACCVVPGFFLHVFCIFGAASGANT